MSLYCFTCHQCEVKHLVSTKCLTLALRTLSLIYLYWYIRGHFAQWDVVIEKVVVFSSFEKNTNNYYYYPIITVSWV